VLLLMCAQVSEAKYDEVNGADRPQRQDNRNNRLGDDVMDEEAEREAFRQAVMEWRQGGTKKVSIVREWEGDGNSSNGGGSAASGQGGGSSKADDSLWHNPFVPMNDDDGDAGSDLLSGDRGDGSEAGPATGSPRAAGAGYNAATAAVRLADGELDEEAEHAVQHFELPCTLPYSFVRVVMLQQFVQAVESWRTGKPIMHDAVQKLKQELDKEQQEIADRLDKEKTAALSKIAEVCISFANSTRFVTLSETVLLQMSKSPRAAETKYESKSPDNEGMDDDIDDEPLDEHLGEQDDYVNDDEDEDDGAVGASQSFVEVRLVETRNIGAKDEVVLSQGQEYFVEEMSDDD
jgi:hypothetical protein